MRFRPCIDIHNGKVKQIVGSTLRDEGDVASENFVSERDAAYYAGLYRENQLGGGHIILLNPVSSEYYQATKRQALKALDAYRGGMQVGGGINDKNAREFIEAGASHVIVTSFVFKDGKVNYEHLDKICESVGKERLVLDLSCRKRGEKYYVVTDRWQNFTDEAVDFDTLDRLSGYCDEFLVHAVDVEGKNSGIDEGIVGILGEWGRIPVTYAGGIRSEQDIEALKKYGNSKLDFTIGSALDLFGGKLEFESIAKKY